MSTSEKVKQLHANLETRVDALVSGEDWQAALAFAARFHRYSFGNTLLIALQCPQATQVAGFHRWRSLGRTVRKAERGIGILAPLVRAQDVVDEQTGESRRRSIVRGFRVVYVFDVSQTEGEPVPEPVLPRLLAGEQDGWDLLAPLVAAEGFRIERGPCGGANGITHFASGLVRVREDVSATQATKTLAHELAHVKLHGGAAMALGCRGVIEVEAESVAFIVCAALGIDASDYSLAYVAHWSAGKRELVAATGERVVRCASSILDALAADAPDALVAARPERRLAERRHNPRKDPE